MATLATFVLSPKESKIYTIDYLAWLDTNETISLAGIVATPPDIAVAANVSTDGKSVFVTAGPGGVDGDEIDVELLVTTTSSQIKEDCIVFQIEDVCP